MSFSNTRARQFLLEYGHVYTFRTHKHKLGKDWINDGRCRPKICDVEIQFVKEVTGTIGLVPYADKSGFSSAWEWTHEIFKLNPKLRKIKGYLYYVVKK